MMYKGSFSISSSKPTTSPFEKGIEKEILKLIAQSVTERLQELEQSQGSPD
jgi:hypothetical protein